MLPPSLPVSWGTVRKLTFEQARQEQRDEAMRMTVAERLAAMTRLSQHAFTLVKEPKRDPRAAFLVRRPF